MEMTGALPDAVCACVGGGSNAMGIFSAFIDDPVELHGVEPLGKGTNLGEHAATMTYGMPGIIHGFRCYLLQDDKGEPAPVHSIASGLDYPGVGPEHCMLKDTERVTYGGCTDDNCMDAFFKLCRLEGLIPAIDPFLTSDNGPWGAIFSVPYIGRTIDWYVDNLIAPNEKDKYRIFDELAIQSVPGADGLKIDLRETPQPIKASRKNISRAVMEGAATLLNEKIKSLAPKGMKFDTAVMVGGPSKSPIWPQIVEEITGLDVSVGSQHAGSKGAALLAGKAVVAE